MLLCKAHTHCLLLSLFKQTFPPEEMEDIPKDAFDSSAAFKNAASLVFPLPFQNTFFQRHFWIIELLETNLISFLFYCI